MTRTSWRISTNICAAKQKLYDENVKHRGKELEALADTIKMLNDDDALELFKKTLPGASSFMELKVSSKSMKAESRCTQFH